MQAADVETARGFKVNVGRFNQQAYASYHVSAAVFAKTDSFAVLFGVFQELWRRYRRNPEPEPKGGIVPHFFPFASIHAPSKPAVRATSTVLFLPLPAWLELGSPHGIHHFAAQQSFTDLVH